MPPARLALGALSLSLGAACAHPAADRAQPVEVLLAATTDVHGRLRGWDYFANAEDRRRGLSRAATIVDSLRRVARNRVILVDAGDLLQGNPMTYVAARVDSLSPSPVVAAMNAMRYDAVTVGNHEFNYGLDNLDRARRRARFPFLAANTRRLDEGQPFPAMQMVERAGIRIALIGVTTPGSMIWDRDHLKDRFVVSDIVETLPAQVAAARKAGAAAVVVVAHAGLADTEWGDTVGTGIPNQNPMARVAHEVPGIDVMVIGHSHGELADTTINGVLLVQPRNLATSVSVVHLRFEPSVGGRVLVAKRGELVQAAGHAEHPAVVAAVARAHAAAVRYSTTVIGRTAVEWRADSARLRDVPLIDLIQQVQLRATGADLSIASAFSLDATLSPGPITIAQVAQLYPYENSLRALRLSGAQVRAYLEHSARYWAVTADSAGALRAQPDRGTPGYNFDMLAGAEYTLDLARPIGQRLTSLTVRGREVLPSDSFTVAINSHRAGGSGGYDMLRGAPVVYEDDIEIRERLVEEVRRRGVLRPEDYFTENWRMLPPRRSLRIVAVNDFHGALRKRADGASGNRGGAAEMAALLRQATTECAPLCVPVLLHGGDLFQGTPASDFAYGEPVARILNTLGFAAGALGNHEFDWGQDTLRARLAQLASPMLGANVTYADGRDVAWIPDDTMLVVGGIQLGVIGIADPATPQNTMPRQVHDLRFAPPAPIVRARSRALRARGARKVVLVAHLGGFCDRADPDNCDGEVFALARELGPGIVDAIVSGHTHSSVTAVVAGVPIVQARSGGRAIGVVDLPLDHPASTSARVVNGNRPQLRSVTSDSITPDPAIAAIVAAAMDAVGDRVNEVIVESAERLSRTGGQFALGNLIADAQRRAGAGDIAVMNNGGIRADLPAGPVTWGQIYEVQPFANRLVAVTVRGAALRRYLEGLVDGPSVRFHVSGLTIEYDPAAPPLARLRRVTMADGSRLDDRRRYRVVMTDFLASGGDGVSLTKAAMREELNRVDVDAFIQYLRSAPGARLTLTDAVRAPRIRAVP